MKSCGMSMIKYYLFVFNLIFAATAIAIIASGSIVLARTDEYNHFYDPAMVTACIILIVVGSLIFLVASLGCFGAIRESYCLLITFAACLVVIFLIEIVVAVLAAVFQDTVIQETLNESVKNYATNEDDRNAWDAVQKELECCGVNGPITWQGQDVPKSCCYDKVESKVVSQYCSQHDYGKYIYENGCLDKLKENLQTNSKVLIGVGVGVAVIEVIGIVLSCLMAFTIKTEDRDK